MPKKKSPTFVSEPPLLFALNRSARRQARRNGWEATYVPMPTLIVEKVKGQPATYWLQHASGELAIYTPYSQTPKES